MLLAPYAIHTRARVLQATRRNLQMRVSRVSRARLSESSRRPSTATRTRNVMHRMRSRAQRTFGVYTCMRRVARIFACVYVCVCVCVCVRARLRARGHACNSIINLIINHRYTGYQIALVTLR